VLTNKNKFAGRSCRAATVSEANTFCLSAADTLLLVPRSGNCAPAGELNCKRAGCGGGGGGRDAPALPQHSRCSAVCFGHFTQNRKSRARQSVLLRGGRLWKSLFAYLGRRCGNCALANGWIIPHLGRPTLKRARSRCKRKAHHTQTALRRFLRFLHNLTPPARLFRIPCRERRVNSLCICYTMRF
jgi:hypothetical protein